MSEIAGRIATQAGAFFLEKPMGGRGILLGGVPGVAAANVMVIGAGAVGINAAHIAVGMAADVFLFDVSIDALRRADLQFAGSLSTVFSSTLSIEEMLPRVDLVIGAVLVQGARAPHVIKREQLALMKGNAVLVDVAIDQGAVSRPRSRRPTPTRSTRSTGSPTTASPTCPAPSRSPRRRRSPTRPSRTSCRLPTTASRALARDPGLRPGVNVAAGKVTHPGVAEGVGSDYVPVAAALDID